MKADKLADVQAGAESYAVLEAALGELPGNGWNMTDEEYRRWQERQMERIYQQIEQEQQTHRESHIQLQEVKRILRTFAMAPVTASSLQPVLDLAHKLNPSLSDELGANDTF